jgi:nucleoside-diphosphate-sugar epimerase
LSGISLFGGSGFLGVAYKNFSRNIVDVVDRDHPEPKYSNIVYAIGTTDNYNIFEDPFLDVNSNIIKLISDLELLRIKFKSFSINYLSSWFVYGDAKDPPFLESQRCEPKGFYSVSKYAAELFLRSYCETYGIQYKILRLANVFGPGDNKVSKKKNALQYLINEIKLGHDVNLYEGGNFFRDYIDVRDVVRAIDIIVTDLPNRSIINVGTGEPYRFIDLIEKARINFKSSSNLISIPTPEFHRKVQVRDAFLDVTLLTKLGFKPKYKIIDEILFL